MNSTENLTDRARTELARLRRAMKPRARLMIRHLPRGEPGAEVGVWKGEFSVFLLRWVRPSELHLVDPWVAVDDPDYANAKYGGPAMTQAEMDVIHQSVVRRFAYDDRIVIHRRPSVEAAEEIPDGSLGWVYLDGDHTFDAVVSDLRAYLPKIRRGGVIACDDFGTEGWWDYGPTRAVVELLTEGAPLRFECAHHDQAILHRT